MSLNYKIVKQVFSYDKTNTVKYVARAVTGEMVPFNNVRLQVSQICGIHRGVTNVVIDGLIDVLVNNMELGHSVQLGEFGILRPGIRAKAQRREEDAVAGTIYRRKVNFVPGKLLKNFLKDAAITRITPIVTDYTSSNTVGGNTAGNTAGNVGGNNNGDDETLDAGA